MSVPSAKLVADAAHRAPGDRIERQRGASPQQHAHGHARRGVGEQLAQDHRRLWPGVSANSGVTHQPAMWTCERAPAIASAMRGSACSPSISTSIALPSRRRLAAARPARVRRRQRVIPPDLAQAAPMMRGHRPLERVAERGVGPIEEAGKHGGCVGGGGESADGAMTCTRDPRWRRLPREAHPPERIRSPGTHARRAVRQLRLPAARRGARTSRPTSASTPTSSPPCTTSARSSPTSR